jgi:hypothetical protein
MTEEWRDIPGYEDAYQVSDLGRVRSVERRVRLVPHPGIETTRRVPPRILKPGSKPDGHVSVCLGKGNTKDVHLLVMLAFVGPRPDGQETLHRNENPADNRLINLRYGTRSENMKMDYASGARKPLDPPLSHYRWRWV